MVEVNLLVILECGEFELRVPWASDTETPDFVRTDAVVDWFAETYGLDVGDLVLDVRIEVAD